MPPCRTDKSKIQQIVYGGFTNCLYSTQRFQADTERKLAVILDRDSQRNELEAPEVLGEHEP